MIKQSWRWCENSTQSGQFSIYKSENEQNVFFPFITLLDMLKFSNSISCGDFLTFMYAAFTTFSDAVKIIVENIFLRFFFCLNLLTHFSSQQN